MKSVQFQNRAITMAANLFFPEGIDVSSAVKKFCGLVVVHPGGGVKEQTAGLYAQQLAKAGFVVIAFDASYQGASGGEPHFLDLPPTRTDDISAAVDFMTTLACVDKTRIGAVGICAGGGYATKATCLDPRIKALAVVSAVNTGAVARKGWEGNDSVEKLRATLDIIANQRTREAAGQPTFFSPYVPELTDKTAPRDMQDAAVYYLKTAQHPNSPNKMLFTGFSSWIGFDAFNLVDSLLTVPLLAIAGEDAGSLWHSKELVSRAKSLKKELDIVKGAAHMHFYDGDGALNAATKIALFLMNNLATQ